MPHDDPADSTDQAQELDPHLFAAIEKVASQFARAKDRWRSRGDEEDDEAADDARGQARDALARLRACAFDEAESLAQSALELDETWRSGEVWREFAILVEEAAAIGRGR